VSVKHAHAAEAHLYDRLFKESQAEGIEHLNPHSKKSLAVRLEPSLRDVKPAAALQFERHGYFAVDRRNASQFNRTVGLRDTWAPGKPA
jgi:glutaminyl-tRNA synthetase